MPPWNEDRVPGHSRRQHSSVRGYVSAEPLHSWRKARRALTGGGVRHRPSAERGALGGCSSGLARRCGPSISKWTGTRMWVLERPTPVLVALLLHKVSVSPFRIGELNPRGPRPPRGCPSSLGRSYSALPRNETRFLRKCVRFSIGSASWRRIISTSARSLSRFSAASFAARPGRFCMNPLQ